MGQEMYIYIVVPALGFKVPTNRTKSYWAHYDSFKARVSVRQPCCPCLWCYCNIDFAVITSTTRVKLIFHLDGLIRPSVSRSVGGSVDRFSF